MFKYSLNILNYRMQYVIQILISVGGISYVAHSVRAAQLLYAA